MLTTYVAATWELLMNALKPASIYRTVQNVLGNPSQLACEVCGHDALSEHAPHESGTAPSGRLFCLVCGAHRLL